MRSRYTAYVLGDEAHLVRSWHPRTRPDDLDVDGSTTWTGLTVEDVSDDGDSAVVAFRAGWQVGAERGVLRERSRFVLRGGRWVYVDGDLS